MWSRPVLLVAPILLRLLLVPLVDDFDADGYWHMLATERIADAIRHDQPLFEAMYVAVWPPFWHLVCALVELVWPNVYFVPKVLAAIFGGLTPFLIHRITLRLSPDPRHARLAWSITALLPLQVLYSTSGMSEPFYAFFVALAALCFLKADRDNAWLIASAAALLPATLTRFDSWILVLALIPLALWQKRARPLVALATLFVLALGPLAWLALNWHVTGRPDTFLEAHSDYLKLFFADFKYNDLYHSRGPLGLAFHVLVLATTLGVMMPFFAVRTALRRWRELDARALTMWLAISFIFLFVTWLVRHQVGMRRHYLAIGNLLVPFAAIAIFDLRRRTLALVLDFALIGVASARNVYTPWRYAQAAAFVREQPDRIYCDEPGVRIISQLPSDRFVSSAPQGVTVDWLRANGVRWVVYSEVEWSPLYRAFPWMRERTSLPPFKLAYVPSAFGAGLPRLHVYELLAAPQKK